VGLVCAQQAALAPGAHDEDGLAGPCELGGLGRGARDVEHRQREGFVHVGRHLRVDPALEEDRLAPDLDLAGLLVDGDDLVDLEWSQRQRYQRRDPVADLQVAVLQLGADLGHGAQQHPPRTGVGIVVLAALRDDAQAVASHLLDVAAFSLLDLSEAGRIDVECIDVDEDLVVVDLHRVVDLPGRLGQDALRLDDPVRAVLVAFLHGRSPFPWVTVRAPLATCR